MIKNLNKAPFPYFGGKRYAAPLVWERLGDVGHYVEPFMGSLAVLLCRPHKANRTYYSETVNDADGFLVNAFRAIQKCPEETANHASWPVSECDLTSRHLWLLKWHNEKTHELIMADPSWCDPRAAGYWIWGISSWIGGGWCSGKGPWIVGEDGRITKQKRGSVKNPGVFRKITHLSCNGRGVNHAGLREPGVSRRRPHLGSGGIGVNRPQLREPGVSRRRPHLGNDGMGVNRPQLREPGVADATPEEWQDDDFHEMTMPEIKRWFRFLSARLRHVRILCGDWTRAVTPAAAITISCNDKRPVGIFLDPPYSSKERSGDIYCHEDTDGDLPKEVRDWCADRGDDPRMRIVLAGYEGEGHEDLLDLGWTSEEWFSGGFLSGGYGNIGKGGHQQNRERLFCSPHCLRPSKLSQLDLFGDRKG